MKYLPRFPFPFSRKGTRRIAAYAEKRNYTNCRLFVAHEAFYFSFYGDEALFFSIMQRKNYKVLWMFAGHINCTHL